MTTKDLIWIAGILIAMGSTWGMTSQRVTAMEKDMDRFRCLLDCKPAEDPLNEKLMRFASIAPAFDWQILVGI